MQDDEDTAQYPPAIKEESPEDWRRTRYPTNTRAHFRRSSSSSPEVPSGTSRHQTNNATTTKTLFAMCWTQSQCYPGATRAHTINLMRIPTPTRTLTTPPTISPPPLPSRDTAGMSGMRAQAITHPTRVGHTQDRLCRTEG